MSSIIHHFKLPNTLPIHIALIQSWNIAVVKAIAWAVAASLAALLYSELMFRGTRYLYQSGRLLRYYPLPHSRNLLIAGLNAFSFIAPTAVFASTWQSNLKRSWTFNPVHIILYTTNYLIMHDTYFYTIHTTFHRLLTLYNQFHAMHHEHSYALNVYMVGYAEMAENFIQVGIPWIAWTYFATTNWWIWLLPLSLIVFTTLIGHSGYKMDKSMAIFHPLIIPFIILSGRHMLTPGDHQVHHSHRKYNFGLVWRTMDRRNGTYRKCDVQAHDAAFWAEYTSKQPAGSEEMQKWMGKHKVDFVEVEWGF